MKIILIVGLPGSGKTHLATSYHNAYVVDDITDLSELPDTFETLVIADVNFCSSKILKAAEEVLMDKYPNATIEYIYFENDPQTCRRNVIYRNDGRDVENTIRRFSKIYNPPGNARQIWNSGRRHNNLDS